MYATAHPLLCGFCLSLSSLLSLSSSPGHNWSLTPTSVLQTLYTAAVDNAAHLEMRMHSDLEQVQQQLTRANEQSARLQSRYDSAVADMEALKRELIQTHEDLAATNDALQKAQSDLSEKQRLLQSALELSERVMLEKTEMTRLIEDLRAQIDRREKDTLVAIEQSRQVIDLVQSDRESSNDELLTYACAPLQCLAEWPDLTLCDSVYVWRDDGGY